MIISVVFPGAFSFSVEILMYSLFSFPPAALCGEALQPHRLPCVQTGRQKDMEGLRHP